MNVYDRLKELNLEIPKVEPRFMFVPGVQVDNLLFISGQTPEVDGEMQFVGSLGEDLDIDTGKKAAQLAALNCLGEMEAVIGDLNQIQQIVRVIGYVRSAKGFGEQPLVINGASKLLIDVFGDKGKHARAALGTSELPFGAPVELEMIVKVETDEN